MPKEYVPPPAKRPDLPARLSPPCDFEPSSTSHAIEHHVERLPRELRDAVYFHLVSSDLATPFHLNEERLRSPFADTTLSGELLEAVFTYRPCHVKFTGPSFLESGAVTSALLGANLPHRHSIRHLTVRAHETAEWGSNFEEQERYCTITRPALRQEWNELLLLPHLSSLTIELQKGKPEHFFNWFDFAPIVFHLRDRRPGIKIRFAISFDALLEPEWNVQAALYAGVEGAELLSEVSPTPEDPYSPMGYAEVSCLIQEPTAEDYAYVKEHLEGQREARGREIVKGLLDETPEGRRTLAEHYVVKEPSLLRVLMGEYYGVYKRMRGESTKM